MCDGLQHSSPCLEVIKLAWAHAGMLQKLAWGWALSLLYNVVASLLSPEDRPMAEAALTWDLHSSNARVCQQYIPCKIS